MKPTVLLMDNVAEYRDTQARLLERAGYHVWKASTIAEADQILHNEWVHLAILDIRMEDENDEQDLSGLIFAEKPCHRHVPKIIVTAYPTFESAVEALGSLDGHPSAIGYVSKTKGPKFLLDHLEHAFATHVMLKWQLHIEWMARDAHSLVNLVEPGLEGERLLRRADELGDLLRQLFREKDHIRINRLLWRRQNSVALAVFAFTANAAPESFVVVCGQNVADVQRAPVKLAIESDTVLIDTITTTHFAADAFSLNGADLEAITSLTDLYRSSENTLKGVLTTLFDQTLAAWHQNQRMIDNVHTLDELYSLRLGLIDDDSMQPSLDTRIDDLIRQALTLGLRCERYDGKLLVDFGTQSFTYRDPVRNPAAYSLSSPPPNIVIMTPGTLTGDNIFADTAGRTWLTDFRDRGSAPLFWNFTSIEAAICLDWVEERNLRALHLMECNLVNDEFAKLNINDVEPTLRKPMRAIQIIRKLAVRTVGKDVHLYQIGLIFHALKRVAEYDPARPLMPTELVRLMHALLAAAMLNDKLAQANDSIRIEPAPISLGLYIDRSQHAVWIDGKRIPIRAQSYDLLCYLYDHATRLCARQVIVEQVFGEKFDELDKAQDSRLNAAIRRLREKIESDSDEPRYLITEPGVGYTLHLNQSP
jgi:DNA-binding response OmpR family regulator